MTVTLDIEALDRAIDQSALRYALPDPEVRRELRKRAGLTHQQIADVMHVSRPAIVRWENGTRTPSGTNLANYIALLDRLVEGRR